MLWVLARCWTCAGSFRLGFSIRSWMPTKICTTAQTKKYRCFEVHQT